MHIIIAWWLDTTMQWCNQGFMQTHPKVIRANKIKRSIYSNNYIEQSNILLKQSAGQAVPYQLNESGYATALYWQCAEALSEQ